MASSSETGTASAISLRTMNLANIPILTGGSNYKKWSREIGLLLTLNEFDIALDIPKPVLTDQSTRAEKADAERWVRANKVALSILKSAMTDTVRGGIKKHDLAIDYLNAIERKFKESQKAEISQYMAMLTTYKIEGTGSIRDHIMKMTDAAEKLNSLDVNIGEKQLVFMILQALPSKFSQLKVYYNTQDKNWDVDELIAQCVQEENRQKQERGKDAEMVNFVQSNKGKKAFNSQSGHSDTRSYLDLSLFVSQVLSHLREKRRFTGKFGAMASSSGTGAVKSLPDSIGSCFSLEALQADDDSIDELPESVCNLIHVKIVLLGQ